MELKPGYRQVENAVIPKDWNFLSGEQITSMIGKGGSPRWQGFDYSNDGMLFVTSENVRSGFLDISSPKYLPLTFHEKLKRTKLQKQDILINLVGASIGRSCQIKKDIGEANVNQAVAVFRVKHEYCSEYIACYFQAPTTVEKILELQVDAARPNLSLGDLRRFLIPLPSIEEQRAIATALSDIDALIDGLSKLITKQRNIKQATMQQLLTGKTRLPGFNGEWKVKPLGELCSLKSGEGITAERIDNHSVFPCYGGNGLRGYTTTYTHEGNYALIGRQGALCGNVISVSGKFFASEHALVVTPSHKTNITWLTFVLGRMNLNQYSESSAQPGLSATKLLILDVNCPTTKEEQSAIAQVLCDIENEITALEKRLEKTRMLKQGMMQELLTGRIRLV